MSATENRFVIYDFYDVLSKLMTEKNYPPENIWNCDESGFPSDPKKIKVVVTKGKPAFIESSLALVGEIQQHWPLRVPMENFFPHWLFFKAKTSSRHGELKMRSLAPGLDVQKMDG